MWGICIALLFSERQLDGIKVVYTEQVNQRNLLIISYRKWTFKILSKD